MGIQTASQAVSNEFGGLSSPFTFRNRVVNGDYQFAQRTAGAALTGLSSYNQRAADMARTGGGVLGSGRYSYQRMCSNDSSATGYESGSAPNGFSNSVKLTVTTTEAENGSTGSVFHSHFIEGYGVADFGIGTTWAKPFTISFWVKSSVTGTYSIQVNNGASPTGACYVTYTINNANTWEYKTINIPPATTTSASWSYTTGVGLRLDFKLKADSTTYNNSVATNVWLEGAAADNKNVIGTVNLFATSGATWYITGLQVELGTTATPFERRPYNLELSLCQRYYTQFGTSYGDAPSGFAGHWSTASVCRFVVGLPVPMRLAPSVSFTNPTGGISIYRPSSSQASAGSDISAEEITASGFIVNAGTTSGTSTAGFASHMRCYGTGKISASSEY